MDEQNTNPTHNNPTADAPIDANTTPPSAPAAPETPVNNGAGDTPADDPHMNERLERLGGEPAPVITPEEFARLQQAGQVHIDARGRVQTARRSDAEAGVSLRKRRAWYT
jgi:hypothetical protein